MGCILWLNQVLSFLLLLSLHFLAAFSSSSMQLCPHDQRFALLQFKNSFSINSYASSSCEYNGIASYPRTNSWRESTDCCSWDGITCDSLTGHVIDLDLSCSWLNGTISPNSSLFLLPHLESINLAFNDFRNSEISSQFGWFASLTHLNLTSSAFSGQVPSEISHLSRLISLDLSDNVELRIETPILKAVIQNLTEVRELFLDRINMSSVAPSSLMNLSSSLTSLSLTDCELRGNFPTNIFYRSKLRLLRLSVNPDLSGYFPKSNWSGPLELLDVSDTLFSGELPDSIGNLESLKSLSLSRCNFTGSIPLSLKNLQQLTLLDFSSNYFSGGFPESIGYLESLTELYLYDCNFTGPISDVFSKLSKLEVLSLEENNFGGQLPLSLFNLQRLKYLQISRNKLAGSIPCHKSSMPNLILLDLSLNQLSGTIPSWLYTVPSLQFILLHKNNLTGHINEFHSRSLIGIYLAKNKLHGPLPSSIFELVNLTRLSLSSNRLSGNVEIDMISKLKNLRNLDLSYNNLSLISTNIHVNYTLPFLHSLYLSSCNIIEFPYFLQASRNLVTLDLSMNKIHSQIPKWMWDVGTDSLLYLNLSHNCLTGAEKLPWKNLAILDLRSNLLQGPLPIPPPQTEIFLISNNGLTGELSSLICNVRILYILDIAHNNLGGIIPPCLGNLSKRLSVLNLHKNNFHGTIITAFSKGCGLKNLNLNGNQLEGPLPQSMMNCRDLEVVDVGNNKFNDTFPYWLGNLPELQVLVLSSNTFHGSVRGSKTHHSFSKLRIFDLSNNDFVGLLPVKYIKNFKAMINVGEGKSHPQYMRDIISGVPYDFSVSITMKGIGFELTKIITIFTSIDLSKNKFEGEIPDVIGRLSSLKGLNLSHNNLEGHIPPVMGNLTNLEWLDLSSNKLVGEIPGHLADLTSLEVLNLSHNQLVGSIPQGNQFNTFNNDSYEGNLGLCGIPLTKTCSNVEPQPSPQEDDSESAYKFGWKVVLMGYGCGMVFGLAVGYLVFQTRKPKWFVMLVEGGQHQKAKKSKKNAQRSGGRRN